MHLGPEHLVRRSERNRAHVNYPGTAAFVQRRSEVPQAVETQDFDLAVVLHQTLTDVRIVDCTVGDGLLFEDPKLLSETPEPSGGRLAAFEAERRVRNLPAVVDTADNGVLGTASV